MQLLKFEKFSWGQFRYQNNCAGLSSSKRTFGVKVLSTIAEVLIVMIKVQEMLIKIILRWWCNDRNMAQCQRLGDNLSDEEIKSYRRPMKVYGYISKSTYRNNLRRLRV